MLACYGGLIFDLCNYLPFGGWAGCICISDESESKIFDLGWVGSATLGSGEFPVKIPNISIFSLWIKKI